MVSGGKLNTKRACHIRDSNVHVMVVFQMPHQTLAIFEEHARVVAFGEETSVCQYVTIDVLPRLE